MDEHGTIHQRTIHVLQRDYPTSHTTGFRKAVQKLQWDWEGWDEDPVLPSDKKPTWSDFLDYGEAWKGGIIPDLWFIDEECMSVICIEVEDTSPINTNKSDYGGILMSCTGKLISCVQTDGVTWHQCH